jgi:predicted RNA-binding Zn ribbon-like protein
LHSCIRDDAPPDRRTVAVLAVAMINPAPKSCRAPSLCADQNYDELVVDLSRNRSRIFCSTKCANRNAAAYRARLRASRS